MKKINYVSVLKILYDNIDNITLPVDINLSFFSTSLSLVLISSTFTSVAVLFKFPFLFSCILGLCYGTLPSLYLPPQSHQCKLLNKHNFILKAISTFLKININYWSKKQNSLSQGVCTCKMTSSFHERHLALWEEIEVLLTRKLKQVNLRSQVFNKSCTIFRVVEAQNHSQSIHTLYVSSQFLTFQFLWNVVLLQ